MSRRRSSGRFAPDAVPSAAPAISRPVVVRMERLQIRDIVTFSQLAQGSQHAEASLSAMPQVIEVLDRIVEGGVQDRPVVELWAIIGEVTRQMNGASDPKN
jgi:hypothetical protein